MKASDLMVKGLERKALKLFGKPGEETRFIRIITYFIHQTYFNPPGKAVVLWQHLLVAWMQSRGLLVDIGQ